ncbi:hypothetical protein BJX63DRAFT_434747 [Aspergillus granulosus]|uniref:Uncharacterized protein n=1 Tax=Aspergillus granulosus TaxID=176169 RepID=A0ABR4H343_9EURO
MTFVILLLNFCLLALAGPSYSAAQQKAFRLPPYPELSYATPLATFKTIPTFAPPYQQLSTLVQNQKTTTWASFASPTDSADPYGNVAWSSLWENLTITPPPFTTTRTARPVPRSELVLPTPLPFDVDTASYGFPRDFEYGFSGAALHDEGRGPSLTEVQLQSRQQSVRGGGSPDITNLNYYLYKQDIARLAAAGVKT